MKPSESRSLHVAIVGPASAPDLHDLVDPSRGQLLADEPQTNTTAPGRIAKALLEAGHRVSIVTHRRGRGALDVEGDGFRFLQVPSRSNRLLQIGSRWRRETTDMVDAIASIRPDVVHSNWTYEAALAGVRSRRPHVNTIRDAPLTVVRYDFRPTRVVRLSMATEFRLRSRRSLLTAASPYMAETWRRQMRDAKPVTVVPNTVDLADLSTLPRKTEGPSVVDVADSGARKNIQGLLRSFAVVRARIPEATLRIAGNDLHPRSGLHDWAMENDLATGVQFLGVLDKQGTQDLMASSWVHAHASLEESFGNTLVEAMSVGTAVVAGRESGAVPWVLGQGRAGRLVDVADVEDFASGIVELLQDSSLRSAYARDGRAHLETSFAPGVVAERYVDVYRDAIARRGAS